MAKLKITKKTGGVWEHFVVADGETRFLNNNYIKVVDNVIKIKDIKGAIIFTFNYADISIIDSTTVNVEEVFPNALGVLQRLTELDYIEFLK